MRVKRNISDKVLSLLTLFPVVVLLGTRQCGKTTLARHLKPNWRYIDLETADHYQLISLDAGLFLKQHPNQVIFDEAQLYPALFRELRHSIDQDRNQKGRYLITGSSSPELSRNIAESLAGRAVTIELDPLKANERFEVPISPLYQQLTEGRIDPNGLATHLSHSQLMTHWLEGGYPEPALSDNQQFKSIWFEQFIQRYLERDLRGLFPGINIQRYQRFIRLLAELNAQLLNYSDIARLLEVSVPTIKDYLDIASGTFLWRKLTSYERSVNKAISKMPKGHFRDTGLLHALLKLNAIDQLQTHPMMGRSFESFIIEEILKGVHTSQATHWSWHHYRTRAQSEIDLILDTQKGPIPIEIKYSSKIQKNHLRIIKQFIKDNQSPIGLWVNNGDEPANLGDGLWQIPARYL